MINWYTTYNITTGEILSVFSDDGSTVEANTPADAGVLEGRFDEVDGYIDVEAKQFVPRLPKPYQHYKFDWTTKQWIDPRTLDEIKQEKWNELKALRTEKEVGGFSWNNYAFDSDLASQQKIIGATQLAQLDGNYVVDWTLKDNSIITLTASQVLLVGKALGAHLTQLHILSQQLRQQIDDATTKEQVELIQWPTN